MPRKLSQRCTKAIAGVVSTYVEKEVSAATMRDGNLIRQLARGTTDTVPNDNISGMTVVHTYCTACSCSEVSHVVLKELEATLATRGLCHSFKQVFGCEIDKTLHSWQMEAVPESDCCLFGDFKGLHQDRAHCYRHQGMCAVKSAEGIIAGLSCKDFSRMNPHIQKTGRFGLAAPG